MICQVHKKEMKVNARGFYCPTPTKKSDDGKTVLEWCPWKPSQSERAVDIVRDDRPPIAAYENLPPAKQFFNGRELDQDPPAQKVKDDAFWARQGRIKALCGMANASLSAGHRPEAVALDLPAFTKLIEMIEDEAKHAA